MSIHLQEPVRHEAVLAAANSADRVACSLVAFVEVRSGLARARYKENPPRLTDSEYERAIIDFERDWRHYARVRISQRLLVHAAALAEKHRLRAYDAIHLASALRLIADVPDRVVVSTWDRDLADAARAEGLSLAHEVDA